MKKLTLTFCALFAFVSALYAGNEKYSGKEKEVMQPAPPVCELYRAHEWDLDIWGTFVFSANPGRNNVPNDDPFFPDADPVAEDAVVPDLDATDGDSAALNPNERINLGQQSKDQFLGRDNSFGGGMDIKYFWSRYFGAGVEGFDVNAAGGRAGGGELATLTVRYPWGRFAPYAWGGAGGLEGGGTIYHFFNEKNDSAGGFVVHEEEFFTDQAVRNKKVRFLGQLGVGLEFRVTCHIGLMTDFAWNFVAGQHTSQNRFVTFLSPGGGSENTPASSAVSLEVPGTGSDNQDFGMVRFGLTFSY